MAIKELLQIQDTEKSNEPKIISKKNTGQSFLSNIQEASDEEDVFVPISNPSRSAKFVASVKQIYKDV